MSTGRDLADCPVVELRRYQLREGHFDRLQRVFQRELVVPQIEAGMVLGGQFGQHDAPDRFVWFRGFASMEQRREALESFYLGPVWRAHADEANATMIDSDDVLLLRPTDPPHPPAPAVAPGVASGEHGAALLVLRLPEGPDAAGPVRGATLESWLAGACHATLERVLATPVAMWRTEPSRNTFPRLPVRAGSFVAALAVWPDRDDRTAAERRMEDDVEWSRCLAALREAGVDAEWVALRPTEASRHPAPPPPASTRHD